MNNERKINKWIIRSSRPWIWEKTQYLYSVQLFLMSNLLWPGSVQRRTQGRGGGYCDSAPLDQWNTRFPGGVMAPLRRRKNVKPALGQILEYAPGWGIFSLFLIQFCLNVWTKKLTEMRACACATSKDTIRLL